MISYIRKTVPIIVIGLFLVGCKEETKTVEWYLENDTERQAKFEECANNPAASQHDGNCKNAMTAELVLTSGSK